MPIDESDQTLPVGAAINRLLSIMERLRHPTRGCPWDIEQDFNSIAPYTIEEAYEVADAIATRDMTSLREELGDLLLQVAYHSQMAAEARLFDFDDVAGDIADKMIARHPHVFGDETADREELRYVWEARKEVERTAKAREAGRRPSVLDDVPIALPALVRAEKLQKRAGRVGFDWPEARQVLEKVREEIGEIEAEVDRAAPHERLEDEIGDLLFAVANLARHLHVDPEAALRRTNGKFTRRFKRIEELLIAVGRTPAESTLEEMETLWQHAKSEERQA